MAKRRPSGNSMVRKRENGRWEGRIVVGRKENGDLIFRYTYADTKRTDRKAPAGHHRLSRRGSDGGVQNAPLGVAGPLAGADNIRPPVQHAGTLPQ